MNKVKNKIKHIVWICFILLFLVVIGIKSFANSNGRLANIPNTDKLCYIENGNILKSQWIEYDNKYYYVDSEGILLMNTITPDGYEVNEYGEWVINGKIQERKIQNSDIIIACGILIGLVLVVCIPIMVRNTLVNSYYNSVNFLNLKHDAVDIVNNFNSINNKISKIKNKYLNEHKLYNCTLQVVGNATREPYKYLCKYFDISVNKDTLDYYVKMRNDYYIVKDSIVDLGNIENEFIANNIEKIPKFIIKCDKRKFLLNIGFDRINAGEFPFNNYQFLYTSAAGRKY